MGAIFFTILVLVILFILFQVLNTVKKKRAVKMEAGGFYFEYNPAFGVEILAISKNSLTVKLPNGKLKKLSIVVEEVPVDE